MRPVDEVRLALSPQTLARLLAEKRMSVDDFRCLDQHTKYQVRSMFLRNLRQDLAARQHAGQPVKRTDIAPLTTINGH